MRWGRKKNRGTGSAKGREGGKAPIPMPVSVEKGGHHRGEKKATIYLSSLKERKKGKSPSASLTNVRPRYQGKKKKKKKREDVIRLVIKRRGKI